MGTKLGNKGKKKKIMIFLPYLGRGRGGEGQWCHRKHHISNLRLFLYNLRLTYMGFKMLPGGTGVPLADDNLGCFEEKIYGLPGIELVLCRYYKKVLRYVQILRGWVLGWMLLIGVSA